VTSLDRSADARRSTTGWTVDAAPGARSHPEAMDILSSILLVLGTVVGVAGTLVLVGGGVAAAALDTEGAEASA
jgi:hypothetical protein